VSKDQWLQLLRTAHDKNFDRITLTTNHGLVISNTQDIVHIETYGNYTFVQLTHGDRLLVSRNLKEFEEMLPEPAFFRVHQSHIVNTRHVKQVI
jgi:two-component system LytT family response regulator